MNTGVYISGAGHGGLILWVLLGGLFNWQSAEPVEVAQVSLISAEEFAALSAPAAAPQARPEPVEQPSPPEPVEAPTPAPEPTPEPPAPETPAPVPEPPAPPAPAPRVAPEAAPAPPVEAEIADEVAILTEPTTEPAPPAPEVEETTAPEQASTRIVTEAEEAQETGLTASIRPRARPERPTPRPQPETPPETPARDPIADAVAEAVAETNTSGTGTAPLGPPVTQGERDALRLAVGGCWAPDVGSEAGRITVTLAMDMNEDGTVKSSSLRMISNSGGSAQAVESAFQAARRAVLRCQRGGYPLPREKYGHWKEIEMVFDTTKMRIK